MKYLTSILIFSIISTIYSQVDLKLYSLDDCSGNINKLEFDLADSNFNLYPKVDDLEKHKTFYSKSISVPKGVYFVFYGFEIENTDYYVRGSIELDLTKTNIYIDTINIPKIRIGWSMVLHSAERYYFNCDKKCNGLETDYYKKLTTTKMEAKK